MDKLKPMRSLSAKEALNSVRFEVGKKFSNYTKHLRRGTHQKGVFFRNGIGSVRTEVQILMHRNTFNLFDRCKYTSGGGEPLFDGLEVRVPPMSFFI